MPERLTATFRPQKWVDDNAWPDGKRVTFDATETFLRLPLEKVRGFRQHDYDSDALADLPERRDHDGPFEVDVEIDDWLGSVGYPPRAQLTQAQLDALRALFGITTGA